MYGTERMNSLMWPTSPYEIKELGLNYISNNDSWISFYSDLISRVFKGDFKKNPDLYALNLLQF
jgi:hypothetical protein